MLILAAPFCAAALLWNKLPDRMPIHWNIQGEVDGYGGKFAGLLLLPVVSVAIYLVTLVIPFFDPGRANYQTFAGSYYLIRISISLSELHFNKAGCVLQPQLRK